MLIFLLSAIAPALVPDIESFQLQAVDPLIKIFPDTEPENNDLIEVDCALNEYQSAQIAIVAGKRLDNVTVELSELVHESGYALPKDDFKWNFVGYIPLKKNTYYTPDSKLIRKAPADFPDPLIEDKNITIEAGRAQPVWLKIFVAKEAHPGKYSGKVTVHTSSEEKSIGVSLNVYPFTIPDERHLFVTLWFDPKAIARFHNVEMWSDEYWKVLGRYAKNMADHRQNVIETAFPSPIERRKDGSLEIDYTSMDRWIEFFISSGACERIEFPAVAHTVEEENRNWWESSKLDMNHISVKDQETKEMVNLPPDEGIALMLADLDMHLQSKGWHNKAMIHISDEPTIYKLDSYCEIADFIHKHAPHLKIIEAIETSGFNECLDVWVPKLSHLANWYDELEAQRIKGTEMWFYTCCHPYGGYPNRFIDFPLIETRILFWLNWKYRLDGYLHWGLNRWTDKPFTDVSEELPPGDGFIIYPGKDGPIDSIRWEASREGLQDYEYFRLLAEKTKEIKKILGRSADFIDENQSSDEICRSVVRSFTDYETDPHKLRKARRITAQEIEDIDKAPIILIQTTPQAETQLISGPILILIRGITEGGVKVKIQGTEVNVKPDGTFAGHAFIQPGSPDIIIEAELNGNTRRILRHFIPLSAPIR